MLQANWANPVFFFLILYTHTPTHTHTTCLHVLRGQEYVLLLQADLACLRAVLSFPLQRTVSVKCYCCHGREFVGCNYKWKIFFLPGFEIEVFIKDQSCLKTVRKWATRTNSFSFINLGSSVTYSTTYNSGQCLVQQFAQILSLNLTSIIFIILYYF